MGNPLKKARTFGSWTKNFGLSNSLWILRYKSYQERYSQIDGGNMKEVTELAEQLKKDYELKLLEGVAPDERLYEYVALELKRANYDIPCDVIYFDEECSDGTKRYKADFGPETNEFFDLIGGGCLIRKEQTGMGPVYFHVPRVLLRNTPAITAPTEDEVTKLKQETTKVDEEPLVSILIPNKDSIPVLSRCIDSIREKTTYKNYEIVIIENNSTEKETFEYYKSVDARVESLVTDWNYAHIMNEGVKFCKGEYILLLNNDTEVIAADWIEQMLHYCLKPEVAAVGARLLFPDNTIQHAGVTFGIRGVAGHAFYGADATAAGYENRICLPQNLTACTAACLLVRRSAFDQVNGFDEILKVNYNDVDLCLKLTQAGYRIVYNPFALLYHHESKTRGDDRMDDKKLKNQIKESRYFQRKWCKLIWQGDKYYNRNLSLDRDDFSER